MLNLLYEFEHVVDTVIAVIEIGDSKCTKACGAQYAWKESNNNNCYSHELIHNLKLTTI